MRLGSVIASVALDKFDSEIEAEVTGVIEQVLISEGTVAEAGAVIACIREE